MISNPFQRLQKHHPIPSLIPILMRPGNLGWWSGHLGWWSKMSFMKSMRYNHPMIILAFFDSYSLSLHHPSKNPPRTNKQHFFSTIKIVTTSFTGCQRKGNFWEQSCKVLPASTSVWRNVNCQCWINFFVLFSLRQFGVGKINIWLPSPPPFTYCKKNIYKIVYLINYI